MAGTTGSRGYTYPTLGDANDVPFYMQTLAEQVDLDVAALNNPAPISPTFESGWGDYPGNLPLTATRSSGGLIGLSGLVRRNGTTIPSTAAEQHIATLPVGYRPPQAVLVTTTGTSAYVTQRIDVYPDGRVTVRYTSARAWTQNSDWISFSGMSFVAA